MRIWEDSLHTCMAVYHLSTWKCTHVLRVGQNHTYTVYIQYLLQEKSPNIRPYTVYIYGSGQPYTYWRWKCTQISYIEVVSCWNGSIPISVNCMKVWSTRKHEALSLNKVQPERKHIGLARTVYIHRIWPCIRWFPCQKYRIYTVYVWLWPTLKTHYLHAKPCCWWTGKAKDMKLGWHFKIEVPCLHGLMWKNADPLTRRTLENLYTQAIIPKPHPCHKLNG